jgi:hypothetical protein
MRKSAIRYLIPRISFRMLPRMLGIAGAGALVAGLYGVMHDQLTYTISEEYFTKLKFDQFRYADFGLHPRIFVAEIGFLATWWVGFFSGWFLARIACPRWPQALAVKHCAVGFSFILGSAMLAACIGGVMGLYHSGDYSGWDDFCAPLGIVDVPGFVRVAYIHNASYLGGLIGLIAAIYYLRRSDRKRPQAG